MTPASSTNDPSSSDNKDVTCPCCNSPWAAATGDYFARFCQVCEEDDDGTNNTGKGKGLSRSNMDFTIHPKDDFYLYANGNWLQQNPIPTGYPNWNSFLTLHVQSQENLKTILEELSSKLPTDITEEERKVSSFFQAAMDESAIEEAGSTPLHPLLEVCKRIVDASGDPTTKQQYAQSLADLYRLYGVSPFFSIGVSPDKMNSDHSIAQLSQGGLGLPDRDYYFDEDKQDKRDEYVKTIGKFLTLLEDVPEVTSTDDKDEVTTTTMTTTDDTNLVLARKVFDLEVDLATSHMTRTENRDPHATYNKMTIDTLTKDLGKDQFDFGSFFLSATTGKDTVDDVGEINVRNTQAIAKAVVVASTVDRDTLMAYLKWKVVSSCAPYLSSVFVTAHFDFFEKTLMGTSEIKPRWKRAMAFTESALGEALGKLFCAKYFDESSKQRALDIVEKVRQALEDRLNEVDWIMADSTRQQALKKMDRFRVKIGYPDEWIDYASLQFRDEDSFLGKVLKSREFENSIESKEMNCPTNKKKWFMTPQTVNAYYHPSLNEIVFPAAILQHPFFDKDADNAVNFGAMGAVIGHEMSHGFDDQGRKYDSTGVLNDWWTEEDSKEYEARVKVMVDQANNFEVFGQNVQGSLTSGENIADLGGLRLALRALKATEGFDDTIKIDGFTPTQRFFLSWAQCWRQNITKERSLQLLTIDPHGPNSMRCNVVSNIAAFHEAFEVVNGDAMYKPEDKRVDIW